MSDKKKLIEDGQDIHLDGVAVINSISVAEKAEEKVTEPTIEQEPVVAEMAPVEEPVVSPEVDEVPAEIPANDTTSEISSEVEPPVIESPQIDISALNLGADDIVTNDLNSAAYSFPSFDNSSTTVEETPIYPEYQAPVESSNVYEFNDYTKSEISSDVNDSLVVYKSPEHVDKASAAFLQEVKSAYDKNIAEPSKAVVNLLNDMFAWGEAVTGLGLNRDRFNEYDLLKARYNGMEVATYGDDNQALDNVINFDQYRAKSYDDDDQMNNGGMGMIA